MASPHHQPQERKPARPPSTISVSGVGHSGYLWLTKKSGKLKLRKTKTKLWFVFDVPSCKLMFSRSPQEAVAQPTNINSLDLIDSTLMFGQDKNQFIISVQGSEFHLTADSHDSMMKWMNTLQDCRELHRKQLEDLEIELVSTVCMDVPGTAEDLLPGTLLGGDSDQEDGTHSAGAARSRSPRQSIPQATKDDRPDSAEPLSLTIGSHASVVLDPHEFLSELNTHTAAVAILESPSEEVIPRQDSLEQGDLTPTLSSIATLEALPGMAADSIQEEDETQWDSGSEKASCNSIVSDSSSATRTSSGDDVDVDVAMVTVARGALRPEPISSEVPEADDALSSDECLVRPVHRTDSMQSFHSGYTMWEHFNCRQSEVGQHDLVVMDDDEPTNTNGFSVSQYASRLNEERKDRRDSKQVQSLKASLHQLESDLRMALNQVSLLENREVAYREKLSKVDDSSTTSKPLQKNQPDSGPSRAKQITMRIRRSASTASDVHTNRERESEVEDLKMAADRYHEQNIVMTKEVVQLVEARREEQKKCQQYTVQCKLLSQDMVRLKISYVDVLQESYPIRLKSAPGDRWDEDAGIDPLEAKNQQRVYALLAECHRYDKTVPVFNKSFPGGKHIEDFGFSHTWDEYNVDMHYYLCDLLKRHYKRQLPDSVAKRQDKNWKTFLADNLWDMNKMAQRSNDLKSLIINGIPPKQRPNVWKSLIGLRLKKYRETKGPGYYKSLQGYQNSHSRQIQVDLHRTLTSHIEFVRGSEMIAKLQRILLAYSIHNPLVGYCQGMNMLVAFGLLILQDEEETFWLMVALVERYLPEHYFDKNLVGAQADQLLMKELLEEKLPMLSQHLDFYGIDVAMVTFNWCLTVFVDAVPTETLLRIWDCLLFEGSRVLFRFSLAILQWHAPRLQRIHDPITLFQHLKLMAKLAYGEDELTKIAYIAMHPFAARKHLSARREHFMAIKQASIDEDDAARVRQKREQAPVAFKSPMQRGSNRPSDVSKRVTVWECAALESPDLLWLCEGDREAGYVSILRPSTAQASLIECDLQSRIMSICKLQDRHMLLGTLLGTLTAFLSNTGCELFTIQLKDSVLSLASMKDGKTFAGLADGTLVVFEKFTAQAISREVPIQSGVSITSLLLVNTEERGLEQSMYTPRVRRRTTASNYSDSTDLEQTTEEDDNGVSENAKDASKITKDDTSDVPQQPENGGGDEVEGDGGGDVPDSFGAMPSLTAVDGGGKGRKAKLVADRTIGEGVTVEQRQHSRQHTLSPASSLLGTGPMLWCGCGNKLLVLDAETLEEVTSIQLSTNQRNNISHLRLTDHGVWTVMHRTATIDLWDRHTFKRLLSVDCAALLVQRIEEAEEAFAAPVSQRATGFAVGKHSLWLGTANGYLLICDIVDCTQESGGTNTSGNPADATDLTSETMPGQSNLDEAPPYKLRLAGLHRVSEDALRVLVVAQADGEDIALHCPQHSPPQLWRQQPSTDETKDAGRVWRSQVVDCENTVIEDLLHLEKTRMQEQGFPDVKGSGSAGRFQESMDFLAEAEMIDPDEIIIKPATIDDVPDSEEVEDS
eukprot:scpid6824/ scgid17288/ TBC1 domain family member 2B